MTAEILHHENHYTYCDPAVDQNPQNTVHLHGCQKS